MAKSVSRCSRSAADGAGSAIKIDTRAACRRVASQCCSLARRSPSAVAVMGCSVGGSPSGSAEPTASRSAAPAGEPGDVGDASTLSAASTRAPPASLFGSLSTATGGVPLDTGHSGTFSTRRRFPTARSSSSAIRRASELWANLLTWSSINLFGAQASQANERSLVDGPRGPAVIRRVDLAGFAARISRHP